MEYDVVEVLTQRRHVALRRLLAPGPDPAQLLRICAAAAQAPDHGQLRPWRFVVIPQARRADLADAFVADLLAREPGADAHACARAAEKAHHAPCLVAAILVDDAAASTIPTPEKLVSLGCALQNMLLAAQAFGYGSGLASGSSMDAPALRRLLRLAAHEQAICFIGFGTAQTMRPPRVRPAPEDFVSSL